MLSYNYPWQQLKQEEYHDVIQRYLSFGVDTFVFTSDLVQGCLADKAQYDFLKSLCREYGVKFVSMHGIWGVDAEEQLDDLNIDGCEERARMIARQKRAIELAAEFGSKTYTVHLGAYVYVWLRLPFLKQRENTLRSLEQLLPVAEKNGVVIAVENSFESPNSPDEVVYVNEYFASSPAIGACYDTGHANVMAHHPGKNHALYASYVVKSWWETGIIEENHALDKMQKYVVTTHIHDNNGYGDLHSMPFDGNLPWGILLPKLRACPRMMEYQTEICFSSGVNWAGKLAAPSGGYTIKQQVKTFKEKLAFDN